MNVQTEHIIAMQMLPVITQLVHSFVHVMLDSQEMGRIVKVITKLANNLIYNHIHLKVY